MSDPTVDPRPDDWHPARAERVLRDLRARLAELPPDDDGRHPFGVHPTRSAPRRRVVAVGALALAVVVVSLGLIVVRWGHDPGEAPTLAALAAEGRQRASVQLREGQYLHTVQQVGAPPGTTENQIEVWADRRGSGRRVTSPMPLRAPGDTDRPTVAVEHLPRPGSLTFAGFGYDELNDLPTDPMALLARVRAVHDGPPGPVGDALALGDLLALDVLPPAVRGAAIEALGRIGGTVQGTGRDDEGRAGVVIAGPTAGQPVGWELVLDRRGGALQLTSLADGGRAPVCRWLTQTVEAALPVEGG